jgi:NOL1/NOP2/fmu family ribosome biogenesis protein
VHLRKGDAGEDQASLPFFEAKGSGKQSREKDAVCRFMSEILTEEAFRKFKERCERSLLVKGGHVSMPMVADKTLGKLNVVKNGLYLGEFKAKGKDLVFVPSNSLALTLKSEELNPDAVISYSYDDPNVIRYLKGETLTTEPGVKGNVVIAVDGFCLGFGKRSADGMIKNLYPKAWRLL